eukprot:1008301-Pelagomonas_calceolata.AAC.1
MNFAGALCTPCSCTLTSSEHWSISTPCRFQTFLWANGGMHAGCSGVECAVKGVETTYPNFQPSHTTPHLYESGCCDNVHPCKALCCCMHSLDNSFISRKQPQLGGRG